MDRPTVSCILMGGLGNQLFQIFATISYGLTHNKRICIPYSETVNIGRTRPTYWKTLLSRLAPFTATGIPAYPRYNESTFSYMPIPDFPGSVTLYGYFQSPRYFDANKSAILRLIGFEQIQKQVSEKYPTLETSQTVSMHFRRGDYKSLPQHYTLLGAEYYAKAVCDFCLRIPKTTFVIRYFCEPEDRYDVEQIIMAIRHLTAATVQQMECRLVWEPAPMEAADWEQMVMMSLSDITIIANSTFSWWGAYLNGKAMLQYCPKTWFGPGLAANDMSTFYPENWIVLQ